MTTEVFVWDSYSCNNSSDMRLIAEFATPRKAEVMAAELVAFFKQHAKEFDKRMDDDPDFDFPGKPTEAAKAFGAKHGHTWKSYLTWGDDSMTGDEPQVVAFGKTVVLYHSYMGGFGTDLPKLFAAAGATLPEKREADGAPLLYGELSIGKTGTKLLTELGAYFAQSADEDGYTSDWKAPAGLKKFDSNGDPEDHTLAIEGDKVSFTWPLMPAQIAIVQKHLEERGALDVMLRLATKDDTRAQKKRVGAKAKAEAAEAKKAAKGSPKKAVKVEMVRPPGDREGGHLFCGAAVADGVLYLVGGLGGDIALKTKDGKTFTRLTTKCGGLRNILVEGKEIWVVGEYGRHAHSSDGKTFTPGKNLGHACLFGVARAPDGTLWIGDDGGQFWKTSPKGGGFEAANKVRKDVAVLEKASFGVLAATDAGLYLIKKDKPQATTLTDHVRHAIETPAGTVIAVGNGGLYRSTDQAKSFEHIKVPVTVPLTYAAVTAGGMLVVVGNKSKVLVSFDDGVTFREVPGDFKPKVSGANSAQALYCCKAFGDAVYIGGDHGAVFRISAE